MKAGFIEFITIDSKLLSKVVEVAVYLPPGYSTSTDRYPTLYFFHVLPRAQRGVASLEER